MDDKSHGDSGARETPSFLEWLAKFPWLNLLLFAATLMTTVLAGSYLIYPDPDLYRFWIEVQAHPEFLLDGLPFSVALLSILMAHELGHYIVSRHHGVACSLPFFIPGPTVIGTFGAVIYMKSRIPDRRALFDIGAAGPLSGLIVAGFTMIVGLLTAQPQSLASLAGQEPVVIFNANLLSTLMMAAGTRLAPGLLPAAVKSLLANPAAGGALASPFLDAACVGFLVTMINLLPIGQLDGGHIAYALFGKRCLWLSAGALALLCGLGLRWWWPWIVLAAFVLVLMGRKGLIHPPPENPELKLLLGQKLLAAVILILFILILSPVPFEIEPFALNF
jgi:membrane-associated protease RseP (regulator of RpoE activity)